MCGIAGMRGPNASDRNLLTRMAQSLEHRGPDDSGIWSDPAAGIGLSHRRLAIVDLSASGHQPMTSEDGRWVICFNGEIYNHADIRAQMERDGQIEDSGWRGHSDTETLVEAISAYGLDAALERSVGMFAFALWDREARALHLVRDRFGEKPLYVGRAGRDVVFASELKAFRKHPDFSADINPTAVSALTSFTVIPAPLSIYKDAFKQLPGTILTLHDGIEGSDLSSALELGTSQKSVSYRRYWNHADVVDKGARDPFSTKAAALDAIEAALGNSIRGQVIADVPIGAFLSGGIDSSLVAALYQRGAGRPIETYTIGFTEPDYDESRHAAAVARHLGCNHHDLLVRPAEARDVIPQLPNIYDEPFADSSQIPTLIVSRFARRSVTVALTGDGGDEMFAGYNRHVLGSRFWRSMSRLPTWARRPGALTLSRVPSRLWTIGGQGPQFGRKVQKGLRLAAEAESLADVYSSFVDEWYGGAGPLVAPPRWTMQTSPVSDRLGPASQMAYWDASTYLPDDILVKVDRAAMSASLETRVPFLDHRVTQVAARVPEAMKVDARGGKAILRDLLGRHLPIELFERPKTGFGIPIGEWLRGPLRDWAEGLLDERRIREDGWFDADMVGRRWRDHLSGRQDATAALWAILMFNAWLDRH